jgi:hypothetical protein
MATGTVLHIELKQADGRRQPLQMDGARALVGSGAHCEVRLGREEAAVEQLLIEERRGAVYAEVRSLERPTLLNGAAFSEGRLLPESVLTVGRVELRVRLAQADLDAPGRKPPRRARSSFIHLLGAIAIPFGLYVVLKPSPEPARLPRSMERPSLFAALGAVECRERTEREARALGDDELTLADGKRERSPFRPEDGVAAVRHYLHAASCLRIGNEPEVARAAAQQAEELRRTLESDFHVHHVRLERALATSEYDRALTEVRILLSFTSGQGGEYSSWLAMLDRHIQLKYAGGKARKKGAT